MPLLRRACGWTVRSLLVTAAALVAPPLSAQQPDTAGTAALMLRVRDKETGHAVLNARVSVGAGRIAGFTDDSGRVALAVAGGKQALEITALGYAPKHVAVNVPGGASADVDVRLEISAIPLQGVDVPAERRVPALEREGFYDRQRFSSGSFLWGNQLAARVRKASFLADLFQGMRGFGVRSGRTGTTHVLVSTRGANSLSLSCYPTIYLDGVDTGWERRDVLSGGAAFTAPGAGSKRPVQSVGPAPPSASASPNVDGIVSPGAVAAVEAYAGADAPLEYRKNPCGVVLIWTRRGS